MFLFIETKKSGWERKVVENVLPLPGSRVTEDVDDHRLPFLTMSCLLQKFSGTQCVWDHFLDAVHILGARSSP